MQDQTFDFEAAWKRIRELSAELRRLKQRIGEARGDLRAYYKSEHWLKLRATYLPGATCCGCGTDKLLQLHHIQYKRIYSERTGDLIVLCGSCHEKLHDFLAKKRWNAKRTKSCFQPLFGKPWEDSFELKLPGPRGTRSPAQKKAARANGRRAKKFKQRRSVDYINSQLASSSSTENGSWHQAQWADNPKAR